MKWSKQDQDKLILSYMGDANREAVKAFYKFNGIIPLNELISIAYENLVRAARHYNPYQGMFWAYAQKRIRGALINRVKTYQDAPGLTIFPLHDR